MLGVLAPYLRNLNFAVDYSHRFHLTHNLPQDDAYSLRLEWQAGPDGTTTVVMPVEDGSEWDPFQRKKMFAYAAGSLAGAEQFKGLLPESILNHFVKKNGVEEATLQIQARSFPPGPFRMPGDPRTDDVPSARAVMRVKGKLVGGRLALLEMQDALELARPQSSSAETQTEK
jgi:hypothetical protein